MKNRVGQKKRLLIANLFVVWILASCSPILGIYGIRSPKQLSEEKILKYSNRLSMPSTEVFQLDSSYYSFLLSLDTLNNDSLSRDSSSEENRTIKTQIKNHYQPLQAMYYSRSGQLESFQINCYAGGFPNLKWDRSDIMNSFPPKIQAPIDSLISRSTLMKYIRPLSKSGEFKFADYDYVVFIFWSKFMGRQNKRFIHQIHRNKKLSTEYKVKFVYVNMDDFYALSDLW